MPNPKCPKCEQNPQAPAGVEMERKGWFGADFEGRGGVTIYQCDFCKNIEVDD